MYLLDLLDNTAGFLDLLLSRSGEILSLDDHWDLWKFTTADDLEEAVFDAVDNWGLAVLSFSGLLADIFTDEGPKLINIDFCLPFAVLKEVKVAHTDFAKVTWVVAIEPCAGVVKATGVTLTTWGLPVLANAAVTHGFVAAEFSRLVETSRHSAKRI